MTAGGCSCSLVSRQFFDVSFEIYVIYIDLMWKAALRVVHRSYIGGEAAASADDLGHITHSGTG